MFDETFLSKRLAQLRMEKNVSAREMSLAIGQSNSYINKIENGRALPSYPVFLYICEYLGVTPQEFFDVGNQSPEHLREFIAEFRKLSLKQMDLIVGLMKELNAGK